MSATSQDATARQLPMRWEELTAREFPAAVERAGGVCIVPIGCMEKHGDHLPLGTDVFEARAIADRAAAVEPAIIFPTYFTAQICEARHTPGTISYSHRVHWDMLTETVDEIIRNGMNKIILLNGHGGNIQWLTYFAQTQLEKRRDASVYVAWPFIDDAETRAVAECAVDGHAGEKETSLMLHIAPELVRMGDLDAPGRPLERAPTLRLEGLNNSIWWYARYPRHYAGDGAFGSAAKGERLLASHVGRTVGFIRAVKADTEVADLEREFHAAALNPLGRPGARHPAAS